MRVEPEPVERVRHIVVVADVRAIAAGWWRQIRQRVVSESRPCAISPTIPSAIAIARRALPVKSMSL